MDIGFIELFKPVAYDGRLATSEMGHLTNFGLRIPAVVHKALQERNWTVGDRWFLGYPLIKRFVIIEPETDLALVAEIAKRYKGKAFSYEIGNEIDTFTSIKGKSYSYMSSVGSREYIYAFQSMRQLIKAADPAAKVVMSSLQSLVAGGHGRGLLHKLLAGGIDTDAINLHHYATSGLVPGLAQMLLDILSDLRAYPRYVGCPLWVTEAGFLPAVKFSSLTKSEQKLMMSAHLGALKTAGVKIALWYCFESSNPYGFSGLGDKELIAGQVAEGLRIDA